jgi:octaheme c-type cytochrome (tetrathionate reductase family)
MRLTTPAAAFAVLLSFGMADAALLTDAYDPVEAEVIAQYAELTGATKEEKKLEKTYKKVLKVFAKDSASRKNDAKSIKKINQLLGKAWADWQEGLDLIDSSMETFLGEIDYEMIQCERCNVLLAEGNKYRNKAVKGANTANEQLGLARNEDTLKARTKWMVKGEKSATKAHNASLGGLELEPDLTPHEQAFLYDRPMGYSGPGDCVDCHAKEVADVKASFHFKWDYVTDQVVGHETDTHGKVDILNNFCIAIPSNEPRCTQCHAGYGWADGSYDLDAGAVDCMICHDTTGTYKKAKKTAGSIEAGIDMTDVVLNAGAPSRQTCGSCHYFAGGGDNVKHGDLASSLSNTTRDFDVHMGVDGGDMSCQSCHKNEGAYDHTTPGHGLTSQEGDISCADCHGETPHGGMLDTHAERVACQTCHIPAFSRSMPTKTLWEWETAGQGLPVEYDEYGKPLYDNMKGTFEWGKNVRPEVAWFNGKWRRAFIGDSDTYDSLPVMLAEPVGSKADETAKLYPFKVMRGNQIADTGNQRIITPHLFGKATGYYPFWGTWSWALSIAEGAMASGVEYSGQYGFVDTEMYMSLNHEVAPKGAALGCLDCHGPEGLDWEGLGYDENPYPLGPAISLPRPGLATGARPIPGHRAVRSLRCATPAASCRPAPTRSVPAAGTASTWCS